MRSSGPGKMRARIDGTGPAIVLLHGIPGSGHSWEPVAQRLRDRYRVIVPDLLGFGASDQVARDALSAPSQAEALADLLDGCNARAAVVAGHDYGGPVGMTLAAARPDLVSSLALFATNAFPDTPIPFPINTVTWPIVGAVSELLLFSRPALAAMMLSARGRPRFAVDVRRAIGGRAQGRAIRQIFADVLRDIEARYAPVERALAGFDGPVFVGWGERDPFFPVAVGERTAATARDSAFRVYPLAGHLLPEERAEEVAQDIAALAARVPQR